MTTNDYRLYAFDAAGDMIYLTPDTDAPMHLSFSSASDVLATSDALLPAWYWDDDNARFVPAFVAYYEVVVPGATRAHAERHVPTSRDHSRCTHERTPKGRAACRRARKDVTHP